jgi:N-acetylglucosamine kinase-like BadF-type ATPase
MSPTVVIGGDPPVLVAQVDATTCHVRSYSRLAGARTKPQIGDHRRVDTTSRILVGVDAGATRSSALALAADGARLGRAEGPGANPKRHGLDVAADRIAALAADVMTAALAADRIAALTAAVVPATGAPMHPPGTPALVFVAGAGIDRPEHALALEAALGPRLPGTRVIVVNDTLAALRAGTTDGVGLAIPVSTGGNVIGRGPDGRVTDRGHGIFGGGYVLGALAARAARRGAVEPELASEIRITDLSWLTGRPRRPGAEAALLGAAVARAAERGDPLPARMVDRWCGRVTNAVREEVERLALGPAPAVIVYGGLGDACPWLADRIRAAVLEAAPSARLRAPGRDPVEGAADLARDAWRGSPIAWAFTPRR